MSTSCRRAAWGALALLPFLIGARYPAAEDTLPATRPAKAASLHPLAELMPGLRQAEAPTWVRVGTRLTYLSGSATRQSKTSVLSLRLDDPFKVPDIDELAGSGIGYTEVNVVALDRKVAVLENRTFGQPKNRSAPLLSGAGSVELAGAGGDFWVNPTVLARYARHTAPGVSFARMPLKHKGKVYSVIGISTRTRHLRQVYFFEEATGKLIRASSTTESIEPLHGRHGRYYKISFGFYALEEERQVRWPWAGAAAPAWVGQVDELTYRGQLTVPIPGGRPMVKGLTATVRVRERGAAWVQGVSSTSMETYPGMPPHVDTTSFVSGTGHIGGMWVSPARLADLRPGQVLDRDRFTGLEASVGRASKLPDGTQVLTLVESNRLQRHEYLYDLKTGALAATRRQMGPPSNGVAELTLTRRR